jgi:cobalt/nickel transport system permease protein
VVALSDLRALAAALGVSLVLMALSGAPAGRTLKRMAAMDGFILFMLATLPFTVPGAPMVTLFGLTASAEGLRLAAEIALTANAVVLALLSLLHGMDPGVLGHALHRLGAPAKLVHLLQFTARYIDVLEAEYRRLRAAMKARGFRPANARHTYRSFGYLVGMLLVRALERSERILDAMRCRGFDGRIPLHADFAFGGRDGAFAVGMIAAAAGLGAVEWGAWLR